MILILNDVKCPSKILNNSQYDKKAFHLTIKKQININR